MRFALKTVDTANRVIAVDLEASDEAAARDLARHRGYAVVSITRQAAFPLPAFTRGQTFPATLFSIELLALLEAGLNVVEALQALSEKEGKPEHRLVLTNLLGALQRGESLSQAVEHLPQHFSSLYVATVRSSERTGNLKESLGRYVAYQEDLDKVRKKVLAALVYPAILIAVGTLVLGFLLFYVVPRFARVYEQLSTGLPFFSNLLLSVGRWIGANGIAAATVLCMAIAGAAYLLCHPRFRTALLRGLWRVPALGQRLRIYQLARFYRTVGMLLRAGIPALKAFDMVSGLLAPNLRAQLSRSVKLLAEGRMISVALTSTGLATPVATRMLTVGERSGQMGEIMDRIARFYDDETARFVEVFTRVFEPLLMTALGLAVGLVVVLMYMPVFELAGSIR